MKKIILSISALALMSFTVNTVYNYHLGEAATNVQDMNEWMMQDLEHGRIDPDLAEHYMYWLEETEKHLIELSEENRL